MTLAIYVAIGSLYRHGPRLGRLRHLPHRSGLRR